MRNGGGNNEGPRHYLTAEQRKELGVLIKSERRNDLEKRLAQGLGLSSTSQKELTDYIAEAVPEFDNSKKNRLKELISVGLKAADPDRSNSLGEAHGRRDHPIQDCALLATIPKESPILSDPIEKFKKINPQIIEDFKEAEAGSTGIFSIIAKDRLKLSEAAEKEDRADKVQIRDYSVYNSNLGDSTAIMVFAYRIDFGFRRYVSVTVSREQKITEDDKKKLEATGLIECRKIQSLGIYRIYRKIENRKNWDDPSLAVWGTYGDNLSKLGFLKEEIEKLESLIPHREVEYREFSIGDVCTLLEKSLKLKPERLLDAIYISACDGLDIFKTNYHLLLKQDNSFKLTNSPGDKPNISSFIYDYYRESHRCLRASTHKSLAQYIVSRALSPGLNERHKLTDNLTILASFLLRDETIAKELQNQGGLFHGLTDAHGGEEHYADFPAESPEFNNLFAKNDFDGSIIAAAIIAKFLSFLPDLKPSLGYDNGPTKFLPYFYNKLKAQIQSESTLDNAGLLPLLRDGEMKTNEEEEQSESTRYDAGYGTVLRDGNVEMNEDDSKTLAGYRSLKSFQNGEEHKQDQGNYR